MHAFRRLVLTHRRLAGLVVLLALAMKLAMPAGYMLGDDRGQVTVSICSGLGAATMVIALPGLATAHHDAPGEQVKAEMPCAFTGLTAPVTGGAEPVLLLVALAVVAALALRPAIPLPPARTPHLRPPLRGPPARL